VRTAARTLPFAALIVVVNALLVEGEPLVAALPFISREGVTSGVHASVRVLVLVFGAVVFFAVAPAEDIAKGVAALVSPFSKRLSRRVAMYAFLSAGFVPLFLDEIRGSRSRSAFGAAGSKGTRPEIEGRAAPGRPARSLRSAPLGGAGRGGGDPADTLDDRRHTRFRKNRVEGLPFCRGDGPRRRRRLVRFPAMKNFKVHLEYDGTDFHGWQRQPGLRTVQGTLEDVLEQVLRDRVTVNGAGRTDAGVHATGQVCSFAAETRGPRGKSAAPSPPSSRGHPGPPGRRSGSRVPRPLQRHGRRYVYYIRTEPSAIWRRYAHVVSFALDLDAMRGAAARLRGRGTSRALHRSGPPTSRPCAI